MHKAFPLLVRKFPLPKGTSHCLKKNATARRKVMPLPEDCTVVIIKKKLSVKDDDFLKISALCPALYSSSSRKCNIVDKDSLYYKRSPLGRDRYKFQAPHCIHSFKIHCNPSASKVHSSTKIQFRSIFVVSHIITLQRLLSVLIILEDPNLSFQQVVSELAPENSLSITTTSTTSSEKSGRTVTLTTEDMQKKKNDVKVRTTLLLSLPDEHQLRFSKHKTAKELWAAILKIFGGNEATKKTKKNLLKQQYGNFIAEGSETLEHTFTRLQVIVGQLQFMGVEVKQDNLNQKFLTSLAPEWLMHTIVWRNRSDLNTMSLDDLYNHLKVYKAEVQNKLEPNTQNMAFISSTKHRRGNDEVNTASVYTASSNVPTASENVDWIYMANDEEDHALVAEAPTEFALMANTSTKNKVFDNSLCSKDCKKNNDSLNSKITDLTDKLFDAKNMIYHYKLALAQVESRLIEYKEREVKYIEKIRTLEFYDNGKMECIETLKKDLETLKQEKEVVDGKLAGLLSASKDLDNLIESQRSDKSKEGLGCIVVPPPVAQLYLSPKKDLSWTGLLECADETVTDYNRPSPTVESSSEEDQNRNPSASENVASPITPKYGRNFPTVNKKVSTASRKFPTGSTKGPTDDMGMKGKAGSSQNHIDDKGYWDSGCSRHMTGNISYLSNYEPFDGGYVSIRQGGCKITKKGTIKTGKLEFENVYFVKDLKYILFSVSQICDSKNSVLFTDSECIVLGRDFKLLDDANIFLRTPRQHNMYSIDLNNIVLHRDLTCLVAKASADECTIWHRRLGHLNVKTMNKLVRHNLVKGLPTKSFDNDHICTACLKGKQHKASCKFEAKGDEGYFLGYSMSSKAFRVFNKSTKRVEENVHIVFLENKAIEKGSGLNWLSDIDSLTKSMNYVPVVDAGTHSTNFSGTKVDASKDVKKDVSSLRYIVLPNWVQEEHLESTSSQPQDTRNTDSPESSRDSNPTATSTNPPADQLETLTVETPIPTISSPVLIVCFTDSQEPSKESNGLEADVSNMETTIIASPTPTLRIHRDHPKMEPKMIPDALQEPSWVEAMQEELLQIKIQKVWSLVDCPKGVRPIGTKWVLKNKKDERGIVIRNKARLVAQGHTQEEGIDYDEKEDVIFLSQDKYVSDILKKFGYSDVRSSNTPMDKENPWGKDGLWYPKDSPFDLVAYSDSDYGGATQDRKSTFGGCQFLGRRLISWQCKKQTIVATSITEAEYVAAASCCGQVMLSMPCETMSKEISTSILRLLHTAKTLDLVWIWLDGDYGKSKHNADFHPIVDFIEASPLRIETTAEGLQILATMDEVLRTVTESSLRRNLKLQDEEGISSLPDTELFENLTLMGYNISPNQKFTFQKVDEPASPVRDVSKGEACPTDSGLIADQDIETIAKSSTLPHDTAPRVTSPAAVEGTQEVEINKLKARVKILEDNQGVIGARSADDAPIKGRRIDVEEGTTRRVSSDTEEIRMYEGEVAVERTSEDIEEMATVLTSMDGATVLAGGINDVPTGSSSIPTAGPSAADIPTSSEVVPTASLVFATATVVTSYSRRKGKEVMVESNTPKKQRLQEQIDAQVARELEEHQEREDKRINNETIAKYLQDYQQFAAELPLERRIELISDLVKYQENYAKIYKFQSQQRRSWTKKQKRDYYMAVIRNNLGWKVKDFKGMTLEEVEAKFNSVYKQMKDFILMGSKEEAKRYKRKAIRFDQESSKKLKSSEEVHKEGQRSYWKIIKLGGSSACYQFFVDLLKHLDMEDLNQLWILVKEYLSIRPASSDKEMKLWVELKRLYESDPEDQLWTQTQNFMHAPIEWKLYDLSGVHQVTAKDKEIFMLVEKDYPLRKGLALVMIWRIVGNKMHKAFPLLVRKFLLPKGTSHCLKKNATARTKVMPLPEDCTAVIIKKKLSVKDDGFLKISALCLALYFSSSRKCNIVYKDSLYYKGSPLVRDRYKFQAPHCIHSFKIHCNPSASKRLLSVLIILEDLDLSFQQEMEKTSPNLDEYHSMCRDRVDYLSRGGECMGMLTQMKMKVDLKAGSESRPLMLNKENYVSWSSRLLCYAKSRPNGKLIHSSIINGPYVKRMIPEPDVDSCETALEIWLRVQQMMKGSDIGIQEKKAMLFNE
nr:ribonuclease H-like domain-containing protein [Tanacetum cinerariifolium]